MIVIITLLILIIGTVFIEKRYRPRIDITKKKEFLLWYYPNVYNEERKFIKLF